MINTRSYYQKLVYFSLIFVLSTVYSTHAKPGSSVNLSLDKFNKTNINGQAFYKHAELNPSNPSIIHIVNVPPEVSFVIVQVHTQGCNVTLSSKNTTGEVIYSGSNVGLEINSDMIDLTKISVTNNYNSTTMALIAAVAYIKQAPTPGKCGSDETIPSQKIITTNAMIIIDVQPAAAPFIHGLWQPCGENSITYEAYRLYVTEGDFTNNTYFSAIKNMLTVDDIIRNGYKIPQSMLSSSMRMIYSAYPGFGSAYAVIAKYGNYSAAYVPTFSYGCDPVFNEDSCNLLNSVISKILCASALIISLFLLFFGHKFFIGPMIIIGTMIGGVIGYTILTSVQINNIHWLIGGSTMIGIIIGLTVTIIWCIKGMPCIGILPASLSVGALMASITYYGMSDGTLVYKEDSTFWAIYGGIMLIVLILLCCNSKMANIISCIILGSFGVILSIDYYTGSSLKYIVINTIRRMTVKGFNTAIINPPMQTAEISLSVFGVIAVLIIFMRQHKGMAGRIPFPRSREYTVIESLGSVPRASQIRGNRRVLPLKNTDTIYYRT